MRGVTGYGHAPLCLPIYFTCFSRMVLRTGCGSAIISRRRLYPSDASCIIKKNFYHGTFIASIQVFIWLFFEAVQ